MAVRPSSNESDYPARLIESLDLKNVAHARHCAVERPYIDLQSVYRMSQFENSDSCRLAMQAFNQSRLC
jgi:hypothetical protein